MRPFSVPDLYDDPLRRAALRLARPAIERALGLATLNSLYARLDRPTDDRGFAARALDVLDIRYRAEAIDPRGIPLEGPLIVVANHPFGGVDGLILADLLTRVRPDVRLLANHVLGLIPELRDLLISVDPFGSRAAASRNSRALRSAMRWVSGGGALVVFPAGEVSHPGWSEWAVTDPPWSPVVGRLLTQTGAAALPVYFTGSNSPLFHVAGLLHARLRTAMLPRELLKQQGRTIDLQVGAAVPFARLRGLEPDEITRLLRLRTYVLAARAAAPARRSGRPRVEPPPVAAPEPPEQLAAEIDRLEPGRCLVESGPFRVLVAAADEIPSVLAEIGRLRERTFRGSGEGTGCARDLDRFDRHYQHLFLWNGTRREIVGAYRLGPTDAILERFGPDGLYTSTLFHDASRLVDELTPALELGRSFVRAEYQRQYAALLLLWKGIGGFVARHPRYRRLFGSVSISNEYRTMSRRLMVAFLYATRFQPELANLVRARHPPRFGRVRGWEHVGSSAAVRDLDEVDALVGQIESDGKGVPVLLRQYLRLGARLLGFNIDPAFGQVLDGLMVVDLARVEFGVLARYMGRDAAARFLGFHGAGAATPLTRAG